MGAIGDPVAFIANRGPPLRINQRRSVRRKLAFRIVRCRPPVMNNVQHVHVAQLAECLLEALADRFHFLRPQSLEVAPALFPPHHPPPPPSAPPASARPRP